MNYGIYEDGEREEMRVAKREHVMVRWPRGERRREVRGM